MTNAPLAEGKDYYLENGNMVFTEKYHLDRGYCCQSGCRHCPYTSVSNMRLVGLVQSTTEAPLEPGAPKENR